MNARDAITPIVLNETEHVLYLTALVSGDTAAVGAIEEKNGIHRLGAAPWIDSARRIWVRAPAWDHGDRCLLSDGAVPALIEGYPGPFKIEIVKATGRPVLFGFVNSLRVNPSWVWGILMMFRKRDMLAFSKNATDCHAFAVAQPNKAASDARIGGLRPVATITDTLPASD